MNHNAKKNMAFAALTVAAISAFSITAYAIDADISTNTGVSTDVGTDAVSGVSTGDNVRINGGIRTGDSTASTRVDTDVKTSSDIDASKNHTSRVSSNKVNTRTETTQDGAAVTHMSSQGEVHRTSGQGHKYGHDQ